MFVKVEWVCILLASANPPATGDFISFARAKRILRRFPGPCTDRPVNGPRRAIEGRGKSPRQEVKIPEKKKYNIGISINQHNGAFGTDIIHKYIISNNFKSGP